MSEVDHTPGYLRRTDRRVGGQKKEVSEVDHRRGHGQTNGRTDGREVGWQHRTAAQQRTASGVGVTRKCKWAHGVLDLADCYATARTLSLHPRRSIADPQASSNKSLAVRRAPPGQRYLASSCLLCVRAPCL